MAKETEWIAVDWGTSSFRLWGVAADAQVTQMITSDEGMGHLTPADYEPILIKHLQTAFGDRGVDLPVYIAGMAGSRQGWQEAPYRQTPCSPAGEFVKVSCLDPRLQAYIHGGVCQVNPADVMRGEEIQIAGLGLSDAVVCLPGTHSKWVNLKDGMIKGFKTFMSGELFDVIRRQTVLKHSLGVAVEGSEAAFVAAVKESIANPADFSGALFSIRAQGLLQGLSEADAFGRLSGLLLGLEVAAVRSYVGDKTVHLIGADPLCQLYALALKQIDVDSLLHDPSTVTLTGLINAKTAAGDMK